MCEYCAKYYSGKGMTIGKSIEIKKTMCSSTDLTDCNVYQCPNETPTIIIFFKAIAKGYIDINFCPMCGEKLSDIERGKDMLSASESRAKTQDKINNCITKKLAELEQQIDGAIASGKYSISNSGCLPSEVIQRLEGLGYKVTTGCQYNESYYCISWA